ncbi:hypothetical protein BVG16_23455 [Paenibacillus selenitireducens]|uniref:DUF1700 domain-containing protein n=1 Tax=Paenibacillus selenitireducens TaxID=1324314 RepID=A0A1T2X496_9BACL|nr:DUF1700 domain-containing protein [Paenibacillus selenitireducens]OPA74714.1 hypothetical protein BVG16_23455 [Paenibacillus selenitireducens]
MNKAEFMGLLERHVVLMPPQERYELLAEYSAHFEFGRQHGKTEEEIARELGNPVELAYEILGDNYVDPQLYTPVKRSAGARVGIGVGLFFLNLVAIPLMVALYALCIGLSAGVIACVGSPLLVVFDYFWNGYLVNYKIFMSLICIGIGLFMWLGVKPLWVSSLKITKKYILWNSRALHGGGND